MIFSNKIYKIASGKNISLYAEKEDEILMFVFKELGERKLINFYPSLKCSNFADKYGYNKVIKLNDLHNLICLNKNMSVVKTII